MFNVSSSFARTKILRKAPWWQNRHARTLRSAAHPSELHRQAALTNPEAVPACPTTNNVSHCKNQTFWRFPSLQQADVHATPDKRDVRAQHCKKKSATTIRPKQERSR